MGWRRVDALWDKDDEWGNVSLCQRNAPVAKGQVPVTYCQHFAPQRWVTFLEVKSILLVLSPCSKVPLASTPSPIESHHRDHLYDIFNLAKLDLSILLMILDLDWLYVNLNDSGADPVKELEAERVRSLGAIHSVHTGVDILRIMFTLGVIFLKSTQLWGPSSSLSLYLLIVNSCLEPDVVVPCVQINSKLQIWYKGDFQIKKVSTSFIHHYVKSKCKDKKKPSS